MIFDMLGAIVHVIGAVVLAGFVIFGVASAIGWIHDLTTYRQERCPLCLQRHGPAHKRAHEDWERL